VQWLHTGGHTPRFLCLTPDASALVVANEDGDTVVGFTLDKQGLPTAPAAQALTHTGSPVCVVFR
jgi:6-phosphogluconolactonase (cycloisomerase 2 family)